MSQMTRSRFGSGIRRTTAKSTSETASAISIIFLMRLLVVDPGESFPCHLGLRCGIFATRLARIAAQRDIQTDILAAWMASGSQWPRAVKEWRHALARDQWTSGGVTHHYSGFLGPPKLSGCRRIASRYLAGKRIAAWLARYGKPDIAHIHWGLDWRSQRAMEVLSDLGVPVVLTEHSSTFLLDDIREPRIFEQYRKAAANARVITAVSRLLAIQMSSRTGIREIEVLPNSIDPVFRPSDGAPPAGKMKVIIVGTHPVKRPELAIDSLRRLARDGHEIGVRLIGGGAQLLARRIPHLPSIRVSATERLTPTELATEFQTSDVSLCLSVNETFGCAPVEAAMCGCALVATRVGVLGDLIDMGCGLAVEPRPECVASVLAEINSNLGSWRSRRREISEIVGGCFGTQAISERLSRLYEFALRCGSTSDK